MPNYTEYKLLTIVNPSSTCTKIELLRVLNHLRNVVGFTNVYTCWFEGFDTLEHRHMHAIIKKTKMFDSLAFATASSKFKRSKIKWVEYGPSDEDDPTPIELFKELDHTKFTFDLSNFNTQCHFNYTALEYKYKEHDQLCRFINNYTLSPSSIPFV